MNILAEKQKKLYELDLSDGEYQKQKQCFLDLYYKLRAKTENSFLGKLSLKTRKRLHGLVLPVYRAKNRLCGFNFEVLQDKRIPTDHPVIFAVTHIEKEPVKE